MKIVFRTDASAIIGHGHVMRCLTLADELRDHCSAVYFVCRPHEGHLCDTIKAKGYKVLRLPGPTAAAQNPDRHDHATWLGASWPEDAAQTRDVIEGAGIKPEWLIVDHYAIDSSWEHVMRGRGTDVMVIDDLADRRHDCDILLDQNYYPSPSQRYAGLLPPYCMPFLGPEFVLLRKEFRIIKRAVRPRELNRLFLFFGGSDPTRQTETAVAAVTAFDPSLAMDVVVSNSNPRVDEIRRACATHPHARFFCQTDRMAELMAEASLALGAGGIATFERLYMGLPSVVVAVASNQCEPLQSLAEAGHIEYLGGAAHVDKSAWIGALERQTGQGLRCPTLNVATRTGSIVHSLLTKLVPFASRHIESTFVMLQDAGVRASFAMSRLPEWSSHVRYWEEKIADGALVTFAIEHDGRHMGNCGIKPVPGREDCEGWIYLSIKAPRRAGMGETSFRRLLRIAFNDLDLPRLYLHVRRDNTPAVGMYRKIGFRPALKPVDTAVWGEETNVCKLVMEQ